MEATEQGFVCVSQEGCGAGQRRPGKSAGGGWAGCLRSGESPAQRPLGPRSRELGLFKTNELLRLPPTAWVPVHFNSKTQSAHPKSTPREQWRDWGVTQTVAGAGPVRFQERKAQALLGLLPVVTGLTRKGFIQGTPLQLHKRSNPPRGWHRAPEPQAEQD